MSSPRDNVSSNPASAGQSRTALLPSPFPNDDRKQTTSASIAPSDAVTGEEDETQEQAYIEPTDNPADPSTSLLPPPNFRPFFTLISDTDSSSYHHPSVHYLFADDDLDILTAASLRSLQPSSTPAQHTQEASQVSESAADDDSSRSELLPPRREGIQERYLVLDVDRGGQTIVNAQSLSADWQILSTEIASAPTWEEATEGDESSAGGGLMLKVEGMSSKALGQGLETEVDYAKSLAEGGLEGVIARMAEVGQGFQGSVEVLKRAIGGIPVEEEDVV